MDFFSEKAKMTMGLFSCVVFLETPTHTHTNKCQKILRFVLQHEKERSWAGEAKARRKAMKTRQQKL